MGLCTSDDMEREPRWDVYFTSNIVHCLRKLESIREEDVSLASIDLTKQ